MNTKLSNCLLEMTDSLLPHSFTRRGKAFFRVIGDGILQAIKPEYEYVCSHHAIRFGLFSMYSCLQPEWFTSSGCIPQYDFVNLIGERTTLRKDNGNALCPISIEEQLDIMRNYGLRFLDGIRNQNSLIEAICHLDLIQNNECRLDMDMHLFGPSLYVGDYNRARGINEAYLNQHKIPEDKRSTAKDIIDAECALHPERLFPQDIRLAHEAEMVRKGSPDEIKNWLAKNYDNNIKLAKFCLNNKQSI